MTSHRYAYGLDDPTDRVDPSGRCSVSLGRAWGPDCGKDGKTKCGLLNGGSWNGCDPKLYIAPKKTKPVAAPVPEVAPMPLPAPTAGGALITNDGGSIIGNDGASIIGNDGASIIGNDGASIIGQDGASLIGQDGASLIGQDGASLIGQDGASLITNDGGSYVPSQISGYRAPVFAESSGNK
jgi:hypothetical protein